MIFAVARASPLVRTTKPVRRFSAAKMCSTRLRTRARVVLPRAMCGGIGFDYRRIHNLSVHREIAARVQQLILGLVVRQRVERLQHEDAEHQHRIMGWSPTPAAIGAIERAFEFGPEQLEIHHGAKPFERISRRRSARSRSSASKKPGCPAIVASLKQGSANQITTRR